MNNTSFQKLHCHAMPENVITLLKRINFIDIIQKVTSIKVNACLILRWKWDHLWPDIHVAPVWMNVTVSFLSEPRKAINWVLLTTLENAITWLTVALCTYFTRLSATASLMNKGPEYWPLLASFEKWIQLKREYL